MHNISLQIAESFFSFLSEPVSRDDGDDDDDGSGDDGGDLPQPRPAPAPHTVLRSRRRGPMRANISSYPEYGPQPDFLQSYIDLRTQMPTQVSVCKKRSAR
jgi:hypothetical protein